MTVICRVRTGTLILPRPSAQLSLLSGRQTKMHIEWIAIATILILAILAWFWPQKYFRPKLGSKETLLKAAFATEVSEEGTRVGRLCLTSTRLVYGIHLGYSLSTGPRSGSGRFDNIQTAEWELSTIKKVEDCSNTPASEEVKIIFRDGKECRFTVTTNSSESKWAAAIEAARRNS
jgi:hypothetical protein